MWASCILAVFLLSIIIGRLHKFFAFPPEFPKKPIEKILSRLAFFKTSIIFLELPDVDMTIRMSFFFPKASKFLEKISLNL